MDLAHVSLFTPSVVSLAAASTEEVKESKEASLEEPNMCDASFTLTESQLAPLDQIEARHWTQQAIRDIRKFVVDNLSVAKEMFSSNVTQVRINAELITDSKVYKVTIIRDNRVFVCGEEFQRGSSKTAQVMLDLVRGREVALLDPLPGYAQDSWEREWSFFKESNGSLAWPTTFGRIPIDEMDTAVTRSRFSVIQELCRIDLLERLNEVGGSGHDLLPLPEKEIEIAFDGVISGASWFHQRGYAHRDIKPENFLLDRNGVYKITDPGQAIRPGEPEIWSLTGSSRFWSPQMWMRSREFLTTETKIANPIGKPADIVAAQRDDIWALGIVLYLTETNTYLYFNERTPSITLRPTSSMKDKTEVWQSGRQIMELADPTTPACKLFQSFLNRNCRLKHPIRGKIIAGCLNPDPEKRLTMTQIRALLEPASRAEASPALSLAGAGVAGVESPVPITPEPVSAAAASAV